MADIYVRSTDGDDADDGSAWALAKATLLGAAAIDGAGDNIYVSQSHNGSSTGGTFAFAGTAAAPTKVIGVNDSAEPPTAQSNTAIDTTTTGLVLSGWLIMRGMTLVNSGAAGGGITFGPTQSAQTFNDCTFRITANDNRPQYTIGGSGQSGAQPIVKWNDVEVGFSNASQKIMLMSVKFEWNGGGIKSGSTSPTILISLGSDRVGPVAYLSGLDISAASAGLNIFEAGAASAVAVVRNSKLPASWSGALYSGTILPGSRYEMHNCDSADTNYRLWVEDFWGTIKSETTWVRTGGASDGTTDYSWRMVSSSNASEHFPLWSPEIAIWNDTVGSSVTVTVEILHDSATALKDDEVWLEVQYLGTSDYPLGSFVSDKRASLFATPADQASSSETWTTTGMSNPNTQKLSVTFTPQEVGYLHARVALGKASYALIVDPMLTVS